MPFTIRAKVDGLDGLLVRLDRLKQGMRNKILRPALRKGSSIISKAAKANLRAGAKAAGIKVMAKNKTGQVSAESVTAQRETRRFGILERSIGVSMDTKGGSVVAKIGPRTGFKEQIGVRIRKGTKSNIGDAVYESAANIAHLVEFGHAGPHPAPAHPFLRPALDNNKAAVQSIMAVEIEKGLLKAAKE
jgi:HK97 gp10 family phage protein